MNLEGRKCDVCGRTYEDARSLYIERARRVTFFPGVNQEDENIFGPQLSIISEIDRVILTLKAHSLEDLDLKGVLHDYRGFFKDSRELIELLTEDTFDNRSEYSIGTALSKKKTSQYLSMKSIDGLDKLRKSIASEIQEITSKRLVLLDQAKNLLNEEIEKSAAKGAMLETMINLEMGTIEGFQQILEQLHDLKVDCGEDFFIRGGEHEYRSTKTAKRYSLNVHIAICWLCSGLFRGASKAAYEVWNEEQD